MSAGRPRAVYIDARPGAGDIEKEVLERRGMELVARRCTSDDEVVELAAGAPAILNSMYWMGPTLFARLPGLKVVVRGGVGFDNIDVEAATRAGVIVCNVVDYGSQEVANHAFAMLLALNRKLVPLNQALREGKHLPPAQSMPHTRRFSGETLGLVSFGLIAREVAKRAHGFDMNVIAFDPYVDPAVARAMNVELVELPDLMARSDYVSIHTPLSSATRGLIGEAELRSMKPSAYLVLTSRGGIVDEAALAEALRDGRLAGAALDVWDTEPPPPDHPLLQLDNVIGSMHMAWYSEVSVVILRTRFAEAAADVLDGIMPRSVVNPEVLAGFDLAPRDPGS
jgi:D-3-phosphoglycerate dehydrogenase